MEENQTENGVAVEKVEGTGMLKHDEPHTAPNLGQVVGINIGVALISTEDLALILGVTVQVIRRMVRDKKIPAYQLDRVFRFRLQDVLEAIRVK